MKKTALTLLLLPLGVVAQSVEVNKVSLTEAVDDSLGINTPIRGGVEQIRMFEVTFHYHYAPGDTLHANPAMSARGRYELMSADSVVIVRSREWDLINEVPLTILPVEQKLVARDVMDAICFAITSRRADLDGSGRCEFIVIE